MADTATAPRRNVVEAFQRWSRIYDSERNPMLSLEERYLQALLPALRGRDVVDLGCGTGRWLVRFAEQRPRRLTGVDISSEMLNVASGKIGDRCRLVHADCQSVSLPLGSADLIVASFLIGYVLDLDLLAEKLRAAVREGGSMFLTDVHPTTQSALGWRRGFNAGEHFQEVETLLRPLDSILLAFTRAGFRLDALVEPCFGVSERPIFECAGKHNVFERSRGFPAIYIAQFGVPETTLGASTFVHVAQSISVVKGPRIAIAPDESLAGDLHIAGGRITFLGKAAVTEAARTSERQSEVDLNGYLVLPGLINSHDHLEFALFPALGNGNYRNSVEWAEDIHSKHGPVIDAQRGIAKATRLWWGGIRNILCGVTTVCHHNPYESAVFDSGFVLRVLRDFGWAHSLEFDSDLAQRYLDTAPHQPFILHLAEGIDEQSAAEIYRIAKSGALCHRTVLVHGVGLDDGGFELLRSSGASLIWCPSSNVFLFGRTLSKEDIERLPSVCLGNDSPLTACGDLLDEIRFAKQRQGFPAAGLFQMVTTRAANILRLREGQGSLRIGALADFFALCDNGLPPADQLAAISWRDVQLVVIGGEVQLASAGMLQRLPHRLTAGLEPLFVDREVRWLRASLGELFGESRKHLGPEIRMNGRKVSDEPSY